MSPAVSVAKAKPAVLGAGAVADRGDIGIAIGIVPVFLRLPEFEESLSHTHYELHGTHFTDPSSKTRFCSNFAEIRGLNANVSSHLSSNLGIVIKLFWQFLLTFRKIRKYIFQTYF